jgi:hypothetical protein
VGAESSAKANQNIKQIFLDLITLVKKKQGSAISDSKGIHVYEAIHR